MIGPNPAGLETVGRKNCQDNHAAKRDGSGLRFNRRHDAHLSQGDQNGENENIDHRPASQSFHDQENTGLELGIDIQSIGNQQGE